MEDPKQLLQVLTDLLNEDVDWAEERRKCSPQQVWEQVKKRLLSDRAKSDALTPPKQNPVRVDERQDGKDETVVFSKGDLGVLATTSVNFKNGQIEFSPFKIREDPYAPARFQHFVPVLNEAGQCRLRGEDGAEYKVWEFSRMVLQQLLDWNPV